MIAPRPVGGLARRAVAAVAASKHHMAAALATGELFTWGCNRDGRLGYPAPDTQATPRRCALLCIASLCRDGAEGPGYLAPDTQAAPGS